MSTTKRIPISEETWRELGQMKGAGETYNDLLECMIHAYNRQRLAEKAREAPEMAPEKVDSIDDI